MEIPQLKTDFRPMEDILYQGYAPNVMSAALEIGLFDTLNEGPMNARNLVVKLGTIENLTEALANSLVAMKLLKKNGADYSLTPTAAEFLVKSSPAYQGGMIAMTLNFGKVMSQIPKILKNGPPRFETDMWMGIEVIKSMGKAVMGGSLQDVTAFIAALPEFQGFRHMCDLGGSHGFYTIALLDKNTKLRGTICDLPKIAEMAKNLIAEMGYADRMDTIGVDLETGDPFGQGYDLVFVSHIIYGWKGRLEDIMGKINKSMVTGGVFVSNHLSMEDDGCGPVGNTFIELMTRLGGYPTHNLSEGELKKALEACGFGDFTVRHAEDGRQYRNLILAARKLG